MFENEIEYKLSSLVDTQFLQQMQDVYANTLDVACIIVDDVGPITKPVNFPEFCMNLRDTKNPVYKKCIQNENDYAHQPPDGESFLIFQCHAGLNLFSIPIVLNNRYLGSIIGGVVLLGDIEESVIKQNAQKFDLSEEEYINYLSKIKNISLEELNSIAKLLIPLAKSISVLAGNNLSIMLVKKKEEFYLQIIEVIRKSLNIEKTKKRIVSIVGKTLNADRCFMTQYDKKNDRFFEVKDEYLSSPDIISYTGGNVEVDVPNFAQYLKNGKAMFINNKKVFIDGKLCDFEVENGTIEKYNVYSAYAIPLYYMEDFLGVLSIHYIHEHLISQDEINLMQMIADQVAIALKQSSMYDSIKKISANQHAILNNIPFMAWLKDSQSRFLAVNEEFAKMCNAEIESILGKTDFDFFPKEHAENYLEEDKLVMKMKHPIHSEDLIKGPDGERWHETFKSPVLDEGGKIIGTVGLARDITERKESEIELLKRQEKIMKQNKQEALLRQIFETMRGSLDMNVIKRTIVDSIGKALDTNICFLLSYYPKDDYFHVDEHSEYRKTGKEKSYVDVDSRDPKFKWFIDMFREHREINFPSTEEFIKNNHLEGSLEEAFLHEYAIKSAYNIAIYYMGSVMGYLILQYTEGYHFLSEDELRFLNVIAAQAGTAFHQARLYNQTIIDAKREKFSRNILEILRSSMDASIIKHLFVQKIGKYFGADRVLFSEYDKARKMYLSVDSNSQYLSSPAIKSFVGYDWSCDDAKDYIQPLLDRREIIIFDWKEYINSNYKSKEFIELFESADVCSSYNFPVLYQEQVIGFFSIEFVNGNCNKLLSDDISLLRNICTQAGIALYHSAVYLEAKDSASSKEDFINNISYEVSNVLNEVIDISKSMGQDDCSEQKHSNCIFNINKNLIQVLNLKSNIESIAEIESEFFKLDLEGIELDSFFSDTVQKIKSGETKLRANIEFIPTTLWLRADKKRVSQVLHNLLYTAISLVDIFVEIILSASKTDNFICIEAKIVGIGLSKEEQNRLFENFKQIASNYSITKKGVGLALLVTKKIVEMHQGRIFVESSEDNGVNIQLQFPFE